MILELVAQAFEEEADLAHGERSRVGESGVVTRYLQEHLAVHRGDGVPLSTRRAVRREPLVSAVPDERCGDYPPKKRLAMAVQILTSRLTIFENRVIGCRVMSAMAAYIFATSWFFFFWSIAMSVAPVGS